MSFNTKKCKLMRITRNRSPISAPLQSGGTTLEVTAEVFDLGLLTNHKLSWNSHHRQDFQQGEQSAWFDKEELQRFLKEMFQRYKNCVLRFG